MVTEIEVEHLIVTDKDKPLDLTIGDGHKIDNVERITEEEITEVKIMVELLVETEEDRTLGEVSVMITEVGARYQEEMVMEDIIAQMQI